MFGMSIYSLAAGLAKDVFHVDEAGLGLLVSSVGIMSFLTAILAVSLGDRIKRSTLVTSGLVIYGLGLWTVAATEIFEIGMIGFGITGIAHVMINVSVTTTVQTYVPPEFRGRVTAVPADGDHARAADRGAGRRPRSPTTRGYPPSSRRSADCRSGSRSGRSCGWMGCGRSTESTAGPTPGPRHHPPHVRASSTAERA